MTVYYIYPVDWDGKLDLAIAVGSNHQPKYQEHMVKVQGEQVEYSKDFGRTWSKIEPSVTDIETKSEKKESAFLPDEPIDVVAMLVNEKIATKSNKFGALYPVLEKTEVLEIPKYDPVQLQEIAEHLLVYCNAQERGYENVCCEDCKSESV